MTRTGGRELTRNVAVPAFLQEINIEPFLA